MNPALLFSVCVLIWGTTWFAIKLQLDAIAPEAGVALRFTVAAVLVLGYCALRGIRLRFSMRAHAWLFGLGSLGFSLSYLFVYHAERFIVSGLVAVGYAASPLVNMVFERICFGTPMPRSVAAGGTLGLAGVGLIFWPEFARVSPDAVLVAGALLTAGAVLASSASNIIVARNQRAGMSGWAPLAAAMSYGAALSWLAALALGRPLAISWSVPFAASLLYLALFGSVLAFASYYALLERIGAARASYVGVASTLVALVVSSALEDFDWRPATFAGVALAVAGNVLALQRPRTRASVQSSTA